MVLPTERVRGAGLPMERAILHGKLEEHEQALRTLALELGDFPAAEDYCAWRSAGREPAYRRRLFHTLLALYLGPGPSPPASASAELAVAAVDLLNRHAAEFDAAQVLQLLPGTWSVQLLCPFLTGAMRDSTHTRRTAQVALGLATSENLIYKHDQVRARRLRTRVLCGVRFAWGIFCQCSLCSVSLRSARRGLCGACFLPFPRRWSGRQVHAVRPALFRTCHHDITSPSQHLNAVLLLSPFHRRGN